MVDRLLIQAVERISRLMHEFDSAAVEEVFSEGLLNVMAEPEFERSDRLRRVFAVLQDRVYLGDLVERLSSSEDVTVFIGSENGHEEMSDVSLVVAPYGRQRPGHRRRRRHRPHAHGLPACHLHGPLRARPHERAGGSPLRMNDRINGAPGSKPEPEPDPSSRPATSRPQGGTRAQERIAALDTSAAVGGRPARAHRAPRGPAAGRYPAC